MCQFLIGKVQRKNQVEQYINGDMLCQFLIGKVQRFLENGQEVVMTNTNVSIPHRQGTTH